MSVNNKYNQTIIISDGETLRHNFMFPIYKKEYLKIKTINANNYEQKQLEYLNDYIIETQFDYSNGGYFILNKAVPKNDFIVIYRETDITQEINLLSLQKLSPHNLTKMFDKLTVICQELNDQYYRSLKYDSENLSEINQSIPLNEINIKNLDPQENDTKIVAIVLKYNENSKKWELTTSKTDPDAKSDKIEATEIYLGNVYLAKEEEVLEGEDDSKVITSKKLKTYFESKEATEDEINNKEDIKKYVNPKQISKFLGEYNDKREYDRNEFVYEDGILFKSLKDNNKGKDVYDEEFWEKQQISNNATKYLGEIVYSILPLMTERLKLLNGSLLYNESKYNDFFNYIKELKSRYSFLFTTETRWQEINTQYNQCGKFVYDAGEEAQFYCFDHLEHPYMYGWNYYDAERQVTYIAVTITTKEGETVDIYNNKYEIVGSGKIEGGILICSGKDYIRNSFWDKNEVWDNKLTKINRIEIEQYYAWKMTAESSILYTKTTEDTGRVDIYLYNETTGKMSKLEETTMRFYISNNKLYMISSLIIYEYNRNQENDKEIFDKTINVYDYNFNLLGEGELNENILTYNQVEYTRNSEKDKEYIRIENVRLPNLIGYTKITNSIYNLGEIDECGLPNIVGEFLDNAINGVKSGPFYDTKRDYSNGGANGACDIAGFDASLANPIYGKSDKVDVQAVNILSYICVIGVKAN